MGAEAAPTSVEVTAPAATDAPAATWAPAGKCTGKKNPMLKMVIGMAPKCLEVCPDLCPMFDNLLSKFGGGGAPDADAIQKKVCGAEKLFACAFKGAGESACRPLIAAGASFNVPKSRADLS